MARRLGVRPALEQVVPADHLARMKPRDVGVDRLGGLERGLAVTQRPRARLGLADGEERDQAERVFQPAHDLVERRRARPELGRLLGLELRELHLELAVDPARPFSTVSSGFVVSGSSAGGSSRAIRQRATRLQVREHVLDFASLAQRRIADFASLRTFSRRRSTWSRSATIISSFRPRDRRAGRRVREAVHDREQRVRLAEPAWEVGARRRDVDDAIAAGVTFFDPTSAARRSRRSSVITAIPTFAFSTTDAYAVTSPRPRA